MHPAGRPDFTRPAGGPLTVPLWPSHLPIVAERLASRSLARVSLPRMLTSPAHPQQPPADCCTPHSGYSLLGTPPTHEHFIHTGWAKKVGPQTHYHNSSNLNRFLKITGTFLGKFVVKWILKIQPHLAYVATKPCEILMSAKQTVNDKLQGSVATYWRSGGVVDNQIGKGWFLSLSVNFYRAMLCIRGTSHGPVSVSVCMSVTSRSSTKTAKRRITQTTPHDSSGALVFWRQRSPRNSTGGHPLRGRRMHVGWVKIGDFWQITGYISKTVKDRRVVSINVE